MNNLLPVTNKYQVEGNLAVIYCIDGRILAFYSVDKDPKFKKDQELSIEEVEASRPYKTTRADSLPSDAYPDLMFVWS